MSSPSKSMILCIHSHQPVGNFDHVFADAYTKAYKPFFDVLEKHPSIPLVWHLSGSLLDWLEAHKPEFISSLKKLSSRGQVEFLGGAYYEPIYGLISAHDLAGQIDLMKKKIFSLFGTVPEGAWLTERVWDPGLVKPLRNAGVEYTILDDFHFKKAGKKTPVTGYYRTKDGRHTLDLFGSIKDLRYLMPFRKAEDTIHFIRALHAREEDAVVFADDSEKFGLWPGTYDWVYGSGWLDEFFTLLEKEKSVKLYTFSQFRRKFKPKGSARVPHASYGEMMEWSGGHFYNFLKKYPESRYMRDRMMSVSRALEKTRSNGKNNLAEAQKALYKAQCNCSYWHGVFGGLYLHHLRSAVFGNLIQAESLLNGHLKKDKGSVRTEKMPSGPRLLLKQDRIKSFFNPGYGAALEEFDYLPKSVNLTCNLQRHRERYHDAVLKKSSGSKEFSIYQILGVREANLEKELHYDPYRRLSLMDHFFEKEVGSEKFAGSTYDEAGDFVGRPYETVPRWFGSSQEIAFRRKSFVKLKNKKLEFVLDKTVTAGSAADLRVKYRIHNKSGQTATFVFGTEFNFSIGEKSASKGLWAREVREWILNDFWHSLRIKLTSKLPVTFLAVPIETISESEYGLERTYQQLSVLLQREFRLKPGETAEHGLGLEVLD